LGAELSDQSEIIRVSVSKGFSTWSASIAGVIAEAQAQGEISKDLPASTLAAFVLNGWEGRSGSLARRQKQSAASSFHYLSRCCPQLPCHISKHSRSRQSRSIRVGFGEIRLK
jgi:hypothetical protein